MPRTYNPEKYKEYYDKNREAVLEKGRAYRQMMRDRRGTEEPNTETPDEARQRKYTRTKTRKNRAVLSALLDDPRYADKPELMMLCNDFFLGFFTPKLFQELVLGLQQEWWRPRTLTEHILSIE